jgi:hypothetical protein
MEVRNLVIRMSAIDLFGTFVPVGWGSEIDPFPTVAVSLRSIQRSRFENITMKKIDLGQTLTILANIGVIAGIAFLAYELRQNNQMMQVQARALQNESATDFADVILSNVELAAAVSRVENGEALSETDKVLLRALALRVYRSWEWSWEEWQAGRLDDPTEGWNAVTRNRAAFKYDLGSQWPDVNQTVSPDFRDWMDENIFAQ